MTHSYDLAMVKVFRAKARCNGYPLMRVRSRNKGKVSFAWQNGQTNALFLEVTSGIENIGTVK
jgi:hypothetical protein